ncbi:hypothetical protein [Nocardiopsis sp. FIRDI 009]|uniref:hypothetical protein n=1 Tax=Nocardiopsis sp. FIRDI 009 TaxID=714197 RepID=UPI001E563B85|nr:hypothetical protein [Nocardiopsis sp. FIRDI 009]
MTGKRRETGPLGTRDRNTRPGVLALLAVLLTAAASALVCTGPPATADTRGATASPLTTTDGGPVVLVGIPGLLWRDVTPESTPALWGLAGRTSIANVSIRTATSRTCPTDGWLSVSAGQRALSVREHFTVCEPAPKPQRRGMGARVTDFETYVRQNAESVFAAPVGLLGQAVRDAGGTTLAIGPGAAVGAADTSGAVDRYLRDVEDLTSDHLRKASLAVVELPELTRLYPDLTRPRPVFAPGADDSDGDGGSDDGGERTDPDDVPEWERDQALAEIDGHVRAITRLLPEGTTLMVVGVSMDTGPSELTVAMSGRVTDEGVAGREGFLASESTRRAGLVALTDTTPSVMGALGVDPPDPTGGRAWHTTARPATTAAAVDELVAFNTAATVVGTALPGFYSGLVTFQLLIYAAAAFALHRYSNGQPAKRSLVFSVTRIVALAGAAFPVASYLANLVPWWASTVPFLALLTCVVAADALVVAAAVAGPWRRSILGPMTVVAGATTAVLFLDLCFGANLQMNSPTGYSPIVAGRFYGIGNIAFATFATGMLMAVAGISHELVTRGRRGAAVATTLAVGAATVLIVGWPGLGTDFGGVIALIPGLAVTAMMIAGVRVTPSRLAVVGVVAVAAITALAWLDLQRPVQARSHVGAFAAQVLSGEAGTVLGRKLSAMLGTFGNWQLTLLAACALVFLFAVLNRPTNWRIGALQRAYEYAPTLRAGLTGSLVTALVGFAVNDSGVAIPAIALTVAVPLALSACVWALQQEDLTPPELAEPARTAQGT